MKILLATISPRRSSSKGAAAELVDVYLERARRYVPCERREFRDEASLLTHLQEAAGRTSPMLVLTDSRGKQHNSEEIAATIAGAQNSGVQQLVLAIGPADGWSDAARQRANMMVAFGRITLPHELAAVIAAEQIYRALTIHAGHPYHCGH